MEYESITTKGTPPRLLTVEEACRKLRVSRWSLYQLIRANQLATVRIGRRRLVAESAIDRFIEERERQEAA